MSTNKISLSENFQTLSSSIISEAFISPAKSQNVIKLKQPKTAVVYCEANFAKIDGKTANGLVRYSEKYKIIAVFYSEKTQQDSGLALGEAENGIPICGNLTEAIKINGGIPDYYIFGIAPASGMLSKKERKLVLEAIGLGINIVNGLHEFLNDDIVFSTACKAMKVEILDIRKPRPKNDLRVFSGRINDISSKRIAILGTDCAIGKRTTAVILTRALNKYGLKTILISTGQTGLIQGFRYGVSMDAVPSQFCAGELEAVILEAFDGEEPDVIIIEGQGALSHPAYSTSSFILRGSVPDGVILQHAPGRKHRCDFEKMTMPEPLKEINLIQTFSDTKVIGLTINHEDMKNNEIDEAIVFYKKQLGLPTTDALTRSPDELVEMVLDAFPELEEKAKAVLN